LRAALGETLDFGRQEFGGVRAATFRLAVRVLGAEQCRKAIGGQLSPNCFPALLGLQEAHRHTESSCVYFIQFLTTKIKGLA